MNPRRAYSRLVPLLAFIAVATASCATSSVTVTAPARSAQKWIIQVEDATDLYNKVESLVDTAQASGVLAGDASIKADKLGRAAEKSLRAFAAAVETWTLLGGDETYLELTRATAAADIAKLVATWGGGQ